jgi:hypothetical protein
LTGLDEDELLDDRAADAGFVLGPKVLDGDSRSRFDQEPEMAR